MPAPMISIIGTSCPLDTGRTSVTGPAQTRLIATSMLPWVALEYGHVWCAASTRAYATLRSKPDRLTLRRAWRK